MAVGLYELIGGAENGEVSSEVIGDFLARNILEPEIRERLLLWISEFEFWEDQTPNYPLVERAKYHRDLVSAMGNFIEPRPREMWGDFGCGPATMSKVIW